MRVAAIGGGYTSFLDSPRELPHHIHAWQDAGDRGLRVSAGCTERKLKAGFRPANHLDGRPRPQRFGSASQRHWQIVKN